MASKMMMGVVERVVSDKGFGFIGSGGTSYFFHRSEVRAPLTFGAHLKGQTVAFEPADGPKGLRANTVTAR